MHLLPRAAFAALLLATTASAWADNATAPGCGTAARQTEAEGGGVGSQNFATHKTDSEAGGVGSANLVTRKTEAEGGGVSSVNQPTKMAAATPCR
jgi:hypothetical protein